MIELNTIEGNFYIRLYESGDESRIIYLFQEIFGHDKPIELWRWEFLENPYGYQIMLCEHESGELVAQCAGIPVPIFFKGNIFKAAQLVDCMCKKEYRAFAVKKKGLFAITVQSFFDVFTGENKDIYLFGFPGERHYRLGKIWLGYRKTRPISEIKLTQKDIKKDFRSYFLFLDEFTEKDLEVNSELLKKMAFKDADMIKFCVVREPLYLMWRYIKSPKNYIIFSIKNIIGKLKAIVVVSENNDEIKIVDIVGINFLKNAVLLVLNTFKEKTIKLWLPKTSSFEKDFIDFSLPSSIPITPVGRSFWKNLNWDWANKNFFYTMGDCDLF